MPRPHKPRNICNLPEYNVFGPKGIRTNKLNRIDLKLDELETIKLIDLLGYTQEDAAKQMKVARTTVQRIYNIARNKIAKSLIEGAVLVVEGGEIVICEDDCEECIGNLRFNQNRKGHGGQGFGRR